MKREEVRKKAKGKGIGRMGRDANRKEIRKNYRVCASFLSKTPLYHLPRRPPVRDVDIFVLNSTTPIY